MQTSLLGGTSIPMTATLIYDPSAPSASDDDLPEWNKGLVGWVQRRERSVCRGEARPDTTEDLYGDEAFALGISRGSVRACSGAGDR